MVGAPPSGGAHRSAGLVVKTVRTRFEPARLRLMRVLNKKKNSANNGNKESRKTGEMAQLTDRESHFLSFFFFSPKSRF